MSASTSAGDVVPFGVRRSSPVATRAHPPGRAPGRTSRPLCRWESAASGRACPRRRGAEAPRRRGRGARGRASSRRARRRRPSPGRDASPPPRCRARAPRSPVNRIEQTREADRPGHVREATPDGPDDRLGLRHACREERPLLSTDPRGLQREIGVRRDRATQPFVTPADDLVERPLEQAGLVREDEPARGALVEAAPLAW